MMPEDKPKKEFEKCFGHLKTLPFGHNYAKATYEGLKQLSADTSPAEVEALVRNIEQIAYAANTNSYFYFYFPIVSHALYYQPQAESRLLSYIVGPNFANGTDDLMEMIELIKGAMKFKLAQDPGYLTRQSQEWIIEVWPGMGIQIQREIDKCQRELDEI